MSTIDELIRVLQHDVEIGRPAADELRRARLDNARYIAAIQERDQLIREYVETIQDLRSTKAGRQSPA